ncbi:hypothetical protein C8J57DRAFT_1493632 [Mycena rebaudengoi]|nr:hypothetical protein C8J57DRAFT_1493632 [Mycena rebaudengoi]
MAEILSKTREELYEVSNGSVDWANAASGEAVEFLQQKGYLEAGTHTTMSVARTALVLLRIAASGSGATANDGIRAVALLVESRRIDRLLDDMRDEVCALAEVVAEEAERARERAQRDDEAAHTLLEAAAVLTRTVDEQVEVSRGATSDLETAAMRAADAAEELRTARGAAEADRRGWDVADDAAADSASPTHHLLTTVGGTAPRVRTTAETQAPRSYAAAAGRAALTATPPTRACAAALAKAAQRETEILVTRAPEVTTHGLAKLTAKEIVAKARMAMTAAATASGQAPPEGAAFVGARLLRSGDVVLTMSSAIAADWQRARMDHFLAAMGGTLSCLKSV